MKVLSVVGARPQFIKLAPVSQAMRAAGIDHVVVDTGQHYDAALSSDLFQDFSLRPPDHSLGIGSGSHGEQTGAMLSALEKVLVAEQPDWVLVYGDTNSTIAGALAAVKLHLPVAHLEAGLRSFNRSMPEEHNRVLTDHASDLLLAPTQLAARNLQAEGLADRTLVVGDVMADVCLATAERMRGTPLDLPNAPDGYVLATLHRPYNTDDPGRLGAITDALAELPLPVILAAHPRLRRLAAEASVQLVAGSLTTVKPFVYSHLVKVAANARAIVTDSGGLQKEAYLLGVPCTTIRSETEWVETLTDNWNQLVFTEEELARLPEVVLREPPRAERLPAYGNGDAAERVVTALIQGCLPARA